MTTQRPVSGPHPRRAGQGERIADFAAACRREIAGELRTDLYSRVLYSTDASLYQLMPHAVLIPRTAEDVAAAVSLAAAFDVPVLARAAGTSLGGQAVNEALVIDFTRHLDAIVRIEPEARRAVVQPGVVLDALNVAMRPHGLQFGPDPASSSRSTIGGCVANNATGSHSIVYGMTADHVLGMAVVLADGSTARFDESAIGSFEGQRIAAAIGSLVNDLDNQQTIRDGTPRHWRHCGGYNLERLLVARDGIPRIPERDDSPLTTVARDEIPRVPEREAIPLYNLVCGSEGTLAVMTEITVGLAPLPRHTGLVLLHFDDLYAALSATAGILETGPSAVELLDTLSLHMCRSVPEYARLLASVVEGQPVCLLVVEYAGESEAAVRAGVERLGARLPAGRGGVTGVTLALTPERQAAVWSVRKAGLGLLLSMKGDMKPAPFIEDAAVPVEALPEYVRQIEQFCAGLDTPISYYGHASAGCLHIRPLINTRSALHLARMADVARYSAGLVRQVGGALSSEHGDGRVRSWLNEEFFGPALYGLYRQVKRIFDPHNRLNPGIITEPAPMLGHLRQPIDTKYEIRDTSSERGSKLVSRISYSVSHLDFSDYERDSVLPTSVTMAAAPDAPPVDGLARAVEMCNGAAVCTQRLGGTMCPSFMVTREEADSTRGRANALRAAMAGVLPPEELTSPRMYAVMELCVSCKACRAECPSAVDMARLKTEFLARYHAAHGIPLRARLFGHIGALNRLGSGPLAGAANAVLGRAMIKRRLGLAAERSLPSLARQSFMAWWRRRAAQRSDPATGIVLLIDPFTNYNHPEIGIAAVEFLEAAGVAVHPIAADDGRAFISKGLVSEARRAAGRTLAALWPAVEAGRPVVGLEPSSLLTLRDEYHYLLPDDPRVAAVSAAALTFEEYVDGLSQRGELSVRFAGEPRHILLHGHCHQKALVGTGPARRVLALPPGYTVEEVDSGCCGMAGSFGYEAEHYAISLQMAERRLLPAVRAAAPETIIVAAGVSCRAQIEHGSGRRALHPAQVLRAALL